MLNVGLTVTLSCFIQHREHLSCASIENTVLEGLLED